MDVILYYVLWLIVAVLSQMSNLCLSLPYYNLIYHSDDEALMLMHDLSKTEGVYFEGKAFFLHQNLLEKSLP